jgi:hypothetical protein
MSTERTDQEASPVLPDDLVWNETGHLSEIVQTAIADGEASIVPPNAMAHLRTCEACLFAVGGAAMLSARVSGWFGESAQAVVAPRKEVAIPWLAIAAALVVAFVGALPAIIRAPLWLLTAARVAKEAIPSLVRAGLTILHDSAMAPALSYASAALLLCVGVAVARKAPLVRTA